MPCTRREIKYTVGGGAWLAGLRVDGCTISGELQGKGVEFDWKRQVRCVVGMIIFRNEVMDRSFMQRVASECVTLSVVSHGDQLPLSCDWEGGLLDRGQKKSRPVPGTCTWVPVPLPKWLYVPKWICLGSAEKDCIQTTMPLPFTSNNQHHWCIDLPPPLKAIWCQCCFLSYNSMFHSLGKQKFWHLEDVFFACQFLILQKDASFFSCSTQITLQG